MEASRPFPGTRPNGFTMVELVIVIGLMAILLAIAVPQFLRAGERGRRASCLANLRHLGDAKEQYAIERRLNTGDPVEYGQLYPGYIRTPRALVCPSGGDYVLGTIGENPVCSKHGGPFSPIDP
jgi:prepilin-type N-terminal cleavage/methylation domain-containing protein